MTRPDDDEFDEFDLTEEQFDEIMRRAEPARLIEPPLRGPGHTLFFNVADHGLATNVSEPAVRAFRGDLTTEQLVR